MLSALVGQISLFDIFIIILFVLFGLFLFASAVGKSQLEKFLKADKTVFATTHDIEATYDLIVKEVEEWHSDPFKPRRPTLNPVRWRMPRFDVYRDTRPRLYRVIDKYAGIITFELTPIEGGGTSVKISYSSEAYDLVNTFKTKLPIKIPQSIGKICPSCKRIYPPTYTHCPYCGIELPKA